MRKHTPDTLGLSLLDGKVCTQCGLWHSIESFHNDKRKADGKKSYCISCSKSYAKKWSDLTPEQKARHNQIRSRRLRENRDDYNARRRELWEKNLESRHADSQRYYQKNAAKTLANQKKRREENGDCVRQIEKKWRGKNRELRKCQEHRRRAREVGNGGSHTVQQWQDLCAEYDFRCLRCGERKPLTRDHVIPLATGGTNDICNIQPLCRSCNCSKQVKHIDYRKKV